MKVFENDFLQIDTNPEDNMMLVDWKDQSANMSKEEHHLALNTLYGCAKEHKPSKLMLNLSKFYYALDATDQQEVVLLSADLLGKDLKKCALVPSKGLMEQLAIEQTVNKVGNETDLIRFFKDELTAKNWLDE